MLAQATSLLEALWGTINGLELVSMSENCVKDAYILKQIEEASLIHRSSHHYIITEEK